MRAKPAIVVLFPLLVVALPAQTPPAPTLAEAAAGLQQPQRWPDSFRALQSLAKERQQAVLEAIAPMARATADAEAAGRARLLIEAIGVAHAAREKRDELRQRGTKVADAVADLKQALGANPSPAAAPALARLEQALQALQQSLAADGPLQPTPLRVPVRDGGGKPPVAAPDAGPAGYREIDVDGKKMLVPADALPEGADYEAEMTEGGLVVKRKKGKAGEKADDKKDEKKKDGTSTPPSGGQGGAC